MTQEDKIEFVRKVQNNTQPKQINIKSMFEQQKQILKKDKTKKEKEKFENKIPDEIGVIGIIHLNRKKMSSKKCLEKHLRYKKHEKKASKIIIVKQKNLKEVAKKA